MARAQLDLVRQELDNAKQTVAAGEQELAKTREKLNAVRRESTAATLRLNAVASTERALREQVTKQQKHLKVQDEALQVGTLHPSAPTATP